MTPGIYFDIPEAEYHSITALSASGIRNMMVSPACFWTHAPWQNVPEDDQEEPVGQDDTYTQILGKAWHAALLEGEEAFSARFGVQFDKGAFEGLRTNDELAERCRELGLKPAKTKAALIKQIREVDPNIPILAEELEKHAAENKGRQRITPGDHQKLTDLQKTMRKLGFLGTGSPEVTFIWQDSELGCLCKARMDYVTAGTVVDLKTWTNRGGEVREAVRRHFAAWRYHVQGCFYERALQETPRIFDDESRAHHVPEKAPETILFVFVEKRTLEVIPMEFDPGEAIEIGTVGGSTIRDLVDHDIKEAAKKYRFFMEKVGPKRPWGRLHPVQKFEILPGMDRFF